MSRTDKLIRLLALWLLAFGLADFNFGKFGVFAASLFLLDTVGKGGTNG